MKGKRKTSLSAFLKIMFYNLLASFNALAYIMRIDKATSQQPIKEVFIVKSRTLLIVLSFSLLFAFALPRSASAIWILDGGIEDTELDRVDSAPHSPYHEVDAGRYGFWNEVSEFVVVLDFDLGGPQSPYSWTEIYWEPGTMDWDAQSSTVEFDNLCFLSEPDFGLQLISSSGSQDSPGVTLLVAPVSDLWREEC